MLELFLAIYYHDQSTTEIDEYRHFRSTSGKTSDKKYHDRYESRYSLYHIDEIDLFGKKLPKKKCNC